MSLLSSPNATATVAQNTSAVTIAGMDLAGVQPSMLLHLGARDRKKGDGLIIASVTPNSGSTGGSLTLVGAADAAFANAAFVIDTGSYNGQGEALKVDAAFEVLNALRSLTSPNTSLYLGDRIVALDKKLASNVSYLALSIGGRSWGRLEQRTLSYTPTGGSATSIETLALRAFPDGTTPTDAVLINLATGGVDVQVTSETMVAAATTDLGSAPAGKVTVTGTANIVSFGAGKHKVRLGHFQNAGAVLVNGPNLILPGNANIAVRANDTFEATSDGSSPAIWRVRFYARADGTPLNTSVPVFQCRLNFAGSTSIRLDPQGGNRLWISGAHYPIPTAGVSLANTGLAQATYYFIYAFMAASVMTLEASTTGHVADANFGHRIKSGDPTRTLVGAVICDTGTPGIFADTPQKRFVASFYNRRKRSVSSAFASASTTATTAIELSSTANVFFFAWPDEIYEFGTVGYSSNSTAGAWTQSAVSIDGTYSGLPSLFTSATANAAGPLAAKVIGSLGEGYHYATPMGWVSAGTGQYSSGIAGSITL